jgi:hypothetical protein
MREKILAGFPVRISTTVALIFNIYLAVSQSRIVGFKTLCRANFALRCDIERDGVEGYY